MEKEKMTQLVMKMQAGDQEAASELYLACRDDLYYYIMKTVRKAECFSSGATGQTYRAAFMRSALKFG